MKRIVVQKESPAYNREWLEHQLIEHIALLFRGFPLISAVDFSSFQLNQEKAYQEVPTLRGFEPLASFPLGFSPFSPCMP